jgi:plasmid stabilization system protein ParE
LVIRDQANDEIDEIARHSARDNLEAGKRFYDAVFAAFDRLARMPGIGSMRPIPSPVILRRRCG